MADEVDGHSMLCPYGMRRVFGRVGVRHAEPAQPSRIWRQLFRGL